MPDLGNPLKHDTLGSVLLGIALVLVMVFFYATSPVRKPIFLVLIGLATLSTMGSYFKYQQVRRQERSTGRGIDISRRLAECCPFHDIVAEASHCSTISAFSATTLTDKLD